MNDFNNFAVFNNYAKFCIKIFHMWQEENAIFIKQEYCMFGDLLDYLQALETKSFKFTKDFYWDMIFEMICVSNA